MNAIETQPTNVTPQPSQPELVTPPVAPEVSPAQPVLPQMPEMPATQPMVAPASVPQPIPVPVTSAATPETPHESISTSTIFAILALVFIYPLGVIFMWLLTKWPKWAKVLISLPAILLLVAIVLSFLTLGRINPTGQLQQANAIKACNEQCQGSANIAICVRECEAKIPSLHLIQPN